MSGVLHVNGEDQGVAYSGCFRACLFPAVSLYGPGESVTIQFLRSHLLLLCPRRD